MRASRIVFCWCSGTGNTALIVERMAEVFTASGVGVELCRIGRDPYPGLPADGALGLAFPVAYQSTYPFVWDFIERLPDGAGREVFMVDTLGGFSGGIVGPLRKRLVRKGYVPSGAREIRMPVNFWKAGARAEKNRRCLARGLDRAAAWAEELLRGGTRWRRVPLLSDLMFLAYSAVILLLYTRWNQRFFRMRASRDLCSGCGLCAMECPAGNIRMTDDPPADPRRPVFGGRCEFCLRCMSVCPCDAIESPLVRAGRYRASDFAAAPGGATSGELRS